MDKPEFLNDLESLLIELHAATQEVKLHGEKHDEYWKAYKSASDELDIANEKLHHINRVMTYCFNNQCDPTEAKIMLSIEDEANKKNHIYPNAQKASGTGGFYKDHISRESPEDQQKSKIKRFFNRIFKPS